MTQHTFITGQFVRIDQQLADVGQRAVASFIDIVMKGLIFSFMMIIVSMFGLSLFGLFWEDSTLMIILYFLVVFIPIFLYDSLMEYFCGGRTLGKMMMGLRVVTADGSKPSFAATFTRSLFYLLEGYTGFGLVAMLFSKDNQRLGDIAADTYVIKERFMYVANPLAATKAMFPQDYKPAYPQAADLSLRQVEVIQEAYYVGGNLGDDLRLKLCQQICKYLKMSVSGLTTQQFLGQLIYDYRFIMADQ